jgi:hypothetical protein
MERNGILVRFDMPFDFYGFGVGNCLIECKCLPDFIFDVFEIPLRLIKSFKISHFMALKGFGSLPSVPPLMQHPNP